MAENVQSGSRYAPLYGFMLLQLYDKMVVWTEPESFRITSLYAEICNIIYVVNTSGEMPADS